MISDKSQTITTLNQKVSKKAPIKCFLGAKKWDLKLKRCYT